MSASTTPQTADQPALHVSNITAHPGSSWAGIGVAVVGTTASFIVSNGVPTTKGGLVMLLGSLVTGLLAALGK